MPRWQRPQPVLGHDYLVLTDHSPRLTVARGLTAERLREQLKIVAELNEKLAPFRLLSGIEVDILDDGSLDQDEALLAQLDVVVASVHSKLRMDSAQMTRRMVKAVENQHSDILGHCTGRLIGEKGREPSTFDAEAVFDACRANSDRGRDQLAPRTTGPARGAVGTGGRRGCWVSIDTDAHAPGQLEWLVLGCEQAISAGVEPDLVVNTQSVAGLLSWTASHDVPPAASRR